MTTKLFLLPMFLHVVFVFWLGSRLLAARVKAVRNGSAKITEVAADTGAWPRKVKQLGNNFDNQFDTPVMWYGAAGLIVVLQLVDMVFVGLSWMFLLTRIGHSIVHTGSNDVLSRMRIFLFGFAMLLFMWMWFGFKYFVLG